VRFTEKALRDTPNLCFLQSVGSAGHVVHSVHPGHKTSMHYFSCSSGPGADPIKSVTEHVTPNLCFCIPCDLGVR
jgi:hypothetical protein